MKNWQKIKEDKSNLDKFLVREKVVDGIREFFKSDGFLEVETPLLVPQPGTEPYLEMFETELITLAGNKSRAFLTTSPELSMKKLLAAGIGNCFQVTRSFRNGEGVGGTHNSEFTILEWYRENADYTNIMDDFEKMMRLLLTKFTDGSKLTYLGQEYDLSVVTKISIAEAFEKYAMVDTDTMIDEEKLVEAAANKGYNVNQDTRWEEAFYQIMGNEIEPELAKIKNLVILYDYPVSQAALSIKKPSDPRFAERFEVYLAGMELGNAFSELNDPAEQRARMEADLLERKKLGKKEFGLDEDFLEALATMPKSAGIAVGVDRLCMLFADTENIADVVFFPQTELFDLK